MYVNYYDREIKQEDENQTIGILLSTDKNETIVKYTLPKDNKTIFSSEYKLHLPTEQELISAVEEERKNYELMRYYNLKRKENKNEIESNIYRKYKKVHKI